MPDEGRPLPAVAVLALAYVAGAVPFSNIEARRKRGVDLRGHGSGTVSGTALYEVAGFGSLAGAGIAEVAKGAVGPLLAGRRRPALAALAAGAAVAGHNWSPFLRGAGGRGLSPAIGALVATAWPGALVLLAGMAGGKLAGETGVGVIAADVALVPVLARTSGRRGAMSGTAVLVPMMVKRVVGNARPREGWKMSTVVNRLLLDRDER